MTDGEEERAALATMFHVHSTELRRVASRFVRSRALAEEIVQDAFLAVWCKYPWPEALRLKAYLFTTVRNLALNQLRRDVIERQWLLGAARDADDTAACAPEVDENVLQLRALLDRLPARLRCTMLLRPRRPVDQRRGGAGDGHLDQSRREQRDACDARFASGLGACVAVRLTTPEVVLQSLGVWFLILVPATPRIA